MYDTINRFYNFVDQLFVNIGDFVLRLFPGTVGAVILVLLKVVIIIWLQLMIRWSLPRFRYDQMMKLCWQGILPLSLANIFVTGIVILLMQE